jgi:hypothetical protein
MTDESKERGEIHAPEWVQDALNEARASLDRERRSKEAGTLVWSIVCMRDANRERAFEILSLRERLERLAESVRAQLRPVLAWFGLENISLSEPPEALWNLGRELAFDPDDFFRYVRIGEAGTVPAVGQGASGIGLRERCDAALTTIHWDPLTEARLRKLKAVIDEHHEAEP